MRFASCGLTTNLSLLHYSNKTVDYSFSCGLTTNLSLLHCRGIGFQNLELWIDNKSEFVTFEAREFEADLTLWIDNKSEFVTLVNPILIP